MQDAEPVGVELTREERTALIIKSVAADMLNGCMDETFFSVCPIGKVEEVTRNSRDLHYSDFRKSPEYKMLHTMHCKDFRGMQDTTKMLIPELVRSVVFPMVGELEISAKTKHGVRLFETAYLPEAISLVEKQRAKAVPLWVKLKNRLSRKGG